MSANAGKIFNVEHDGPECVDPLAQVRRYLTSSSAQFQTTAAQAQADASTAAESQKIEDNAEAAKISAQEVADFAQSKGKEFTGEPPTTTEKLQTQAKSLTDTAVAEGKQDVNAASASAESYLDQAKAIATQVLSSAQATAQVCCHRTTASLSISNASPSNTCQTLPASPRIHHLPTQDCPAN